MFSVIHRLIEGIIDMGESRQKSTSIKSIQRSESQRDETAFTLAIPRMNSFLEGRVKRVGISSLPAVLLDSNASLKRNPTRDKGN